MRHVINLELPKSIEDYVHRIGRTGRVGNRGKATSFFSLDQDSDIKDDLVRILTQANQEVPEFLKAGGGGGGRSFQSDRTFGGRDVRKSDAPAAHGDDDEEWDN